MRECVKPYKLNTSPSYLFVPYLHLASPSSSFHSHLTMKYLKSLSAISKTIVRFSTSTLVSLPRVSPKKIVPYATTPPFRTIPRYLSSLPNNNPSPSTDGNFSSDEDNTKALEEVFKKIIEGAFSVFAKLNVERLMDNSFLHEELQFQQAFSTDGYEVFLNVCRFQEKELEVYVEDKILYVKANEKISRSGMLVKVDRYLCIPKFVFFDPEKGTGYVRNGGLMVSFPFTGKIHTKKEGKFVVKWVEP